MTKWTLQQKIYRKKDVDINTKVSLVPMHTISSYTLLLYKRNLFFSTKNAYLNFTIRSPPPQASLIAMYLRRYMLTSKTRNQVFMRELMLTSYK